MVTGAPPRSGYVLTFGETMALVTTDGGLDVAHGATVGIGGAESNVAIGLVRLGRDVTWVGRVGSDSLGERVRRDLRAEGVRTVVTTDSTAPTGLMVKERRTPLSTDVWYYRAGSAGSRLSPGDFPAGLVEGAALVHVTGITPALSATAAAAVDSVLDRARSADVTVSFDVNHRARLWPDTGSAVTTYRRITARCDLVFAGLDEARLLVGDVSEPPALTRAVTALGPGEVVVKLGPHGAVAAVEDRICQREAYAVPVVDTVGAGDAFVAGYLAEQLAGSPMERRLDTALRAGAFACMACGDWEGLARRSDLDRVTAADPVSR